MSALLMETRAPIHPVRILEGDDALTCTDCERRGCVGGPRRTILCERQGGDGGALEPTGYGCGGTGVVATREGRREVPCPNCAGTGAYLCRCLACHPEAD